MKEGKRERERESKSEREEQIEKKILRRYPYFIAFT